MPENEYTEIDNSLVFPGPAVLLDSGDYAPPSRGMTILDYFAGQALAGIWANRDIEGSHAELAQTAYNAAAAMREEKKKREYANEHNS